MASNYSFHGQHPDEDVIAVFKRNPWSYIKSALKIMVFFWIPWIILMFFGFTKVFSVTVAIVLIIGLAWMASVAYLWNANIVIITSQRVMLVGLTTPINRKVTEVPLRNIQDSSFESHGLLSTLFGFGDIKLQTAGSKAQDIVLKNLDAPYDVQQLISRTMKS